MNNRKDILMNVGYNVVIISNKHKKEKGSNA